MGKRAPFILVALFVVLLVGGSGALYAYDSGRDDVIAEGVRVAGYDVGGMRRAEATRLLQQRLGEKLNRPFIVTAAGHRFRLTPERAALTANVGGMVARAVADSRRGNILSRSWRDLRGRRLHEAIKLDLSYDDRAVRSLVRHIARRVNRAPKDASVTPTAGGLQMVSSSDGRALRSAELRARLRHALATPGASHRIAAHMYAVQPKVTTAELASQYPVYVIVNRSSFRLTIFDHLKPAESYPIAVGQAGLETPAGLYHVQDKQVDPSWHVPNSDWAGDLAGKVIPPGPDDPIKARWLGIYNGAGIHGTDELDSIGHAASHGCIRMRIPDVIDVYKRVPVGAPVFIA